MKKYIVTLENVLPRAKFEFDHLSVALAFTETTMEHLVDMDNAKVDDYNIIITQEEKL